jgi:hypothetical protein
MKLVTCTEFALRRGPRMLLSCSATATAHGQSSLDSQSSFVLARLLEPFGSQFFRLRRNPAALRTIEAYRLGISIVLSCARRGSFVLTSGSLAGALFIGTPVYGDFTLPDNPREELKVEETAPTKVRRIGNLGANERYKGDVRPTKHLTRDINPQVRSLIGTTIKAVISEDLIGADGTTKSFKARDMKGQEYIGEYIYNESIERFEFQVRYIMLESRILSLNTTTHFISDSPVTIDSKTSENFFWRVLLGGTRAAIEASKERERTILGSQATVSADNISKSAVIGGLETGQKELTNKQRELKDIATSSGPHVIHFTILNIEDRNYGKTN